MENLRPIDIEVLNKLNETEEKAAETDSEKLDGIKAILAQINDKLGANKSNADAKPKEEKVDTPSLWKGLGDFGKSLSAFAKSGNIMSALGNFRNMVGAGREATGAISNAVLGHTTLSGKLTKTQSSSETNRSDSTSTSLSQKVAQTTNNVLKEAVSKSSKTSTTETLSVGKNGLPMAEAGAGEVASGVASAAGAAGRGGAAAGGAGASAAGGLAAAASTVGIVVAVGAALAALPVLIRSWGDSLLESQRKLSEVSGSMAQVFAQKEVADTMRQQRIGDATAGSAGGLSDALGKLEDKFEPFLVIITNFLNGAMTGFVEFATRIMDAMIDGINMCIKGINKLIPGVDVLTEIDKNTRPVQQQSDLGNVLTDWSAASTAYRSGVARGF